MRFFNSESFLLLAAASLSLYSVDAQSKCDNKVSTFLFGGDCPTEGNKCPSECKQALDNANDECSKDGATMDGAPYDVTNVLLASFFFLGESPCLSNILESSPDTCQSYATLHMASTMFICNDKKVCSEFCTNIIDGFYDTCTEDDVMLSTEESGDITSTPIPSVVMAVDYFASKPCGKYLKDKELKKTTNSTSVEPIVTTDCADVEGKPILWGKQGKAKSCEFLKKGTKKKCSKFNTAEVCPKTCGECDGGPGTEPSDCEDSKGKVVPFKNNKPNKTCGWAKKNTKRCAKKGVAELCPSTCGMC